MNHQPMDNPLLDFDVARLVPTDGAYGKVKDDLEIQAPILSPAHRGVVPASAWSDPAQISLSGGIQRHYLNKYHNLK
ncbi:hypothetical protein PRIPAC_78872 [Pristionchus pacificus]|uniref:Uncharacterized protein n=1 Tax=Pristionchus pacificus TaxID=54126 RepID=A0A2A6BVU8_PRIPA|nr:hypothetical protein PRIPAC_78872 [Pristionchus pacificus]|eukprot:PDM70005.1 hypothetical protein PRIPAC_49217 [Pristionchus pacificus]